MKNQEAIEVLFTGDLCPQLRVEQMCLEHRSDNIYGAQVRAVLREKDLSVTNLECPLTDRSSPIIKSGPALRSSKSSIAALTSGYFDVAALANNHILDQDEVGVADTLAACTQADIATVGAGANIKEASHILYKQVKGRTIAIINAAEHEFCIAGKNSYGANPLNPIHNYYQITEAKEKADYVIMIIHGGNEHHPLPNPSMVDMYRYFADLGVTAIIGHHSHFAGGYEVYHGVPIFYSLGNFVFDTEKQRPAYWHQGYLVKLTLDQGQASNVQVIPYTQERLNGGFQVRLLPDEAKQQYLEEVDKYSRIIQDREQLQTHWRKFLEEKKGMYYAQLLGLNRVQRFLLKKNLLNKRLVNEKRVPVLANLFRCQAHREATIATLEQDFRLK